MNHFRKLAPFFFAPLIAFTIFIIAFNAGVISEDYQQYLSNYSNFIDQSRFEIGFKFLVKSLSPLISFEYFFNIVLLLISILYTLCIPRSNFSNYIFITPLLICFASTFGIQIRFALAAVIFLYSFTHKNKQISLILLSLSLTIHNLFFVILIAFIFNWILTRFFYQKIRFQIVTWVLVVLTSIFLLNLMKDELASLLGYDSYINSEEFTPKSVLSQTYISLQLIFFTFLRIRYKDFLKGPIVELYNTSLLLTVIFFSLSVVSGRIFVFSTMIDPILLLSFSDFFKSSRLAILYRLFLYVKLLTMHI
jgi:hypothetical protein